MYEKIPNFEKCVELCEKYDSLSHSIQSKNGQDIHSFKYNVIPSPEVWKEEYTLNMRGITFIDKKLVALPFNKFFNLNENEFTQDLDITDFKYCFAKIDGSLISMFRWGNGDLDVKSMKSINSEVAIESREFIKDKPYIIDFCNELLDRNMTPMFEYVSNTCRIVIDYGAPELYYLGARNMTTGEIEYSSNDKLKMPTRFNNYEEFNHYLSKTNVEGVVITLNNGQMVKCKTDEYCNLHRILDGLSDKNIIARIFNDTVDDLKSVLSTNNLLKDLSRVEDLYEEYINMREELLTNAKTYIKDNPNKTRKEISLELMSTNKSLANDVFNVLSNRIDKIHYKVYTILKEKYKIQND